MIGIEASPMKKKAVWNIIAAAALWGCIGVFLKLLTAAGLSSMDGVALRSAVAALLYGLFLAATDRKALKIQPRHWYYFLGSGVCSLVFFNWCYFSTISIPPPSSSPFCPPSFFERESRPTRWPPWR